jgi:hypothetical protein
MSKPRLKLHVRILAEEQIAFGPGKAELLKQFNVQAQFPKPQNL